MKNKKGVTKAQYERMLNEIYSDGHETELLYLTSINRSERVTLHTFKKHVERGTLGKLLRRLDPIAFEVGYNDFKSK